MLVSFLKFVYMSQYNSWSYSYIHKNLTAFSTSRATSIKQESVIAYTQTKRLINAFTNRDTSIVHISIEDSIIYILTTTFIISTSIGSANKNTSISTMHILATISTMSISSGSTSKNTSIIYILAKVFTILITNKNINRGTNIIHFFAGDSIMHILARIFNISTTNGNTSKNICIVRILDI